MTVAELIAKLQSMPQDIDVVVMVPEASQYGWELREKFIQEGDWQEGVFYSKETLKRWATEAPLEKFTIKNPAVGIEIDIYGYND